MVLCMAVYLGLAILGTAIFSSSMSLRIGARQLWILRMLGDHPEKLKERCRFEISFTSDTLQQLKALPRRNRVGASPWQQ